MGIALAAQRPARAGRDQPWQWSSANNRFRSAIPWFIDAAARRDLEVRVARKSDELDGDAAGGREKTGSHTDPRAQRPGRFFRRRCAQRSLGAAAWRVFMARLIRIARALQTYSGVLLMMLWAASSAIAADAPRLTEAVMEVTLSNAEPGEMVVVLRGPDGELYL